MIMEWVLNGFFKKLVYIIGWITVVIMGYGLFVGLTSNL